MNKRLLIALLLVPVISLSACRRTPLINVESAPLGAPADATMKQVADAIKRAASGQIWRLTQQTQGHFIGNLDVRGKHKATVSITHDTKDFSIVYEASYNLNYSVERSVTYVHPSYLKWVERLKHRIQSEASAI